VSLPWVEELRNAPTPWGAFLRLTDLPHVLFLDTVRPEGEARYSFLTACPFRVIHSAAQTTRLYTAQDSELAPTPYLAQTVPGDPITAVANALDGFSTPTLPDLPPFQGGAAGVLGYGLGRHLEEVPIPRWDEFGLPDMVIGLYDWVLAYDHRAASCHLISHGFPATEEEREPHARRRAAAVLERLHGPPADRSSVHPSLSPGGTPPLDQLAPSYPLVNHPGLLSNFSQENYLAAVARAIEYIRAGDIFQVNLSQRLLHPADDSPTALYERLRIQNPAPYAGYFDAGDLIVASSSPEQFLSVSGKTVVTRPIKGTHPRGYTPLADAYGRDALFESDKNRSENVMIVDLQRNDISRVCKPHSVKVPTLFELEGHPTVHHLVSEVRGELREDRDVFDLLRAAFPGGSITGAPKVRAMEVIQELEPTARGPYCGSLGWIGFDGSMNLNILIRTMTVSRGWIQFPVGGGIVVESHPESEYQETLHKAAGMVRALVK
jgi:para-aminobenzoate synthetase component 1